jgi:hypothetical protein
MKILLGEDAFKWLYTCQKPVHIQNLWQYANAEQVWVLLIYIYCIIYCI